MNGKRILQNLPFALSGGVLLALLAAGNSKKLVLLCGVLALAGAAALGFAPRLTDWLRQRLRPAALACGGAAAVWGGVLFARHWKFEGIAARLGLDPALLVDGLAVAAALAALPGALALAAWLLETADTPLDRRLGAALHSRALFWALWAAGLALLALQFYFAFANDYIWQDEVFTLKLIRHPVSELVALTAVDVHPPLYYLIVKAFVALLPGVPAIPLAKLVSLLPYALLLAGAAVAARQGGAVRLAAGVFALCIGGMPKLMDYGTEIRMYSWGLFFVTAGMLAAWDAGRTNRRRGWAGLVVFGLLAAYTHYFACVAVAAAYLALLAWQLARKNRAGLLRWGVAALVTAAAYLPWLFVLLAQLRTVSDAYWIEPITAETVRGYATFALGSGSLWLAVVLVTVLWLAGRPRGSGAVFTAASLLCPVWTVAMGLVASALVRPVFVARYLVPELGCLWLGVAAALAALRCRRCQPLLAAVLCLAAWGNARLFVADQRYQAEQAASTLAVLDAMPADAKLVSSATRVEEKLAGLCERESYGWQVTPGELPKSVYDNLYDLTDAATLADWVQDGESVYFFEDPDHPGAAAEAARQAGLRAWQVAECALGEELTVWRIGPA